MQIPHDVDEERTGDEIGRRLFRISSENCLRNSWMPWQGSDPYYIAYILYVTHGKIDITPYLDGDQEEVRKRQQEKIK